MPSITIAYDLHPPTGTPQQPNLSSSKSQEFAFKGDDYYAGLSGAIAVAKETVGTELTEWRDRVGDLEKGKDAKKTVTSEDSEQEEDQEE